jgi:SAM-dependent methyltransferase
MWRSFFRVNRAACEWLARYLPNARGHTFQSYTATVENAVRSLDGGIALDIGGGKTCAFAAARGTRVRIAAVDISAEELRQNHEVDFRLAADVTRGLPFADASISLMASRSVLEHLDSLEPFMREARRVMRPGAYFIHWVPGKFAPFAVINQLLPHALAKKVLFFTDPGAKGICGFHAVYDRCYPSALRHLLEKQGFEIEHIRPSYYQSQYYAFFLPFYVLSSLYEIVLQTLRIQNLCAHVLIVARVGPTRTNTD